MLKFQIGAMLKVLNGCMFKKLTSACVGVAVLGMAGTAHAAIIDGTNNNDVLIGTASSDTISGFGGNDFLDGRARIDFLSGGDGADTFAFSAASAFLGADRILDFSIAEGDMLDVSDILIDFDPITDAIGDFVQITDDGENSLLLVDPDGGSDSFNVIAILLNTTGLTDVQALFNNGTLIAIPSLTPQLSCNGFLPPFDRPLALKKKAKRAIPVKIELTDADGFTVTDLDIAAPPVINVLFNAQVFGEVPLDTDDLLPLGSANDDNIFRFDPDSGLGEWVYNLGTKQFQAEGTYTVMVASGDTSEYEISAPSGGACTETFERLP